MGGRDKKRLSFVINTVDNEEQSMNLETEHLCGSWFLMVSECRRAQSALSNANPLGVELSRAVAPGSDEYLEPGASPLRPFVIVVVVLVRTIALAVMLMARQLPPVARSSLSLRFAGTRDQC